MHSIKNSQALTNLHVMSSTFSDAIIQPGSKPENLVSNWACTSIYKKSTFRGRIWQFIHWFAGTSESSLRKTITETAKVANLSIQEECHRQKHRLEKINDPGVLGSFWKSHSVSQMQTSLAEVVKYCSLVNTIQWATGDNRSCSISKIEEQTVEKAVKKIYVAIKLEKTWKKYASDISITVLYRELQSTYPRTQKELEKHRDYLQKTTCGEYPKETKWFGERPVYGNKTKCPAELLYSPLVALARELATHELPRNDLTQLFQELMGKSSLPNGEMLLDLTSFLKDPTVKPLPNKLPPSVAKAVMNPNWVRRCNSEVTADDSGILGCRRDWIKKQRVFRYPIMINNPLNHHSRFEQSFRHEDYMQKRHIRKFYCYEKNLDGRESISVREFAQEVSG